jgi:predicted short-subunit dehydrogenase-like oxidoreductase (DUF2520 family)
MSQKNTYVIIGAGNLAYHLSKVISTLKNSEVIICHHRSTPLLKAIAKDPSIQVITSYSKLPKQANVYFLCVSDTAIKEVFKKIAPMINSGIVCHCSGSTAIDILKNPRLSYGVFYPLQSFSLKRNLDWKEFPLLIEAMDKKSTTRLKSLGKQISSTVLTINSEKRKQFHLAAVMANNFVNALLLAASKQIHKTELRLLKPIVRETIEKAFELRPENSQTGPAKRNDKAIMQTHLKMLRHQKEVSQLYKIISQYISRSFKN